MKSTKKTMLVLTLTIAFIFVACSSGNDASIPNILEKTVGTRVNTSFTSGITDNENYTAIYVAVFDNTTEADYTTLMEHYQSASTGTDENGSLLFDWGRLQVTSDNGLITVNAFIK